MGCSITKMRKLKQRIADQDRKIEELLAEVEALKSSSIVDADGPQGENYERIVDLVVFKQNDPSDVKKFFKNI